MSPEHEQYLKNYIAKMDQGEIGPLPNQTKKQVEAIARDYGETMAFDNDVVQAQKRMLAEADDFLEIVGDNFNELPSNKVFANIDRPAIARPIQKQSIEYGEKISKSISKTGLVGLGVGAILATGALVSTLNSSRGQQSNAQLYGQQPVGY